MSCFLKQDPRDYFDSQQVNALKALGDAGSGEKQIKSSVSSHKAYGSLRNLVSDIRVRGLGEPVMSHEVALKVLNLHMYLSLSEVLITSFTSFGNKVHVERFFCLYECLMEVI